MDGSLRDAYETCRRMHRRRDPTYYFATRRLPRELRPATHALYAYVRTADDIVDSPAPPDERRADLDAWEEQLSKKGPTPFCHPVVLALRDAADRHHLPLHELDRYIASMRIDCAPVRIETYEELETYMDGSAGSVGRIMAALLGLPAHLHVALGRLGLAFQLTNFLRDIPDDRRLDRIYLPAEDRRRFGVEESDLDASDPPPQLRELIAFEVERARALFTEGEDAVLAAPPRVRRGMRLACEAYGLVLDKTESRPRAPKLSPMDWPRIAVRTVRG